MRFANSGVMSDSVHPLKASRLRRGTSQQQDADAIGVNVNTFAGWERAEMMPAPRRWAKIQEVTGVTAEQITAAFTKAEAAV